MRPFVLIATDACCSQAAPSQAVVAQRLKWSAQCTSDVAFKRMRPRRPLLFNLVLLTNEEPATVSVPHAYHMLTCKPRRAAAAARTLELQHSAAAANGRPYCIHAASTTGGEFEMF